MSEQANKKVIYIDMDNVLVNFKSGIDRIPPKVLDEMPKDADGNPKDLDEIEGIFGLMDPVDGAIEAFKLLDKHHHVYILSTAPWNNHSAWSDKVAWVQRYIGKAEDEPAHKRLILSHHKDRNAGDYLIDDRTKNGAGAWGDRLIHFGPKDAKEKRAGDFPDWQSVIDYFVKKGLLPEGSKV
jgi:5'-nucleotidase